LKKIKVIEIKFKKIIAEISIFIYLSVYKKHKTLEKVAFRFMTISLISLAKSMKENPNIFRKVK
jgi:hypothetical protein